MSLKSEIKTALNNGLKDLFSITNAECKITDIDGNVTIVKQTSTVGQGHPMYKKIEDFSESFSTTLANEILKLKVDIATASNPDGKLVINGANGGGAVVWSSTVQPLGALKDD